jgi:Tyrosine-protein kinase ephrin type A/B receptor-like/IPT/TIG domain
MLILKLLSLFILCFLQVRALAGNYTPSVSAISVLSNYSGDAEAAGLFLYAFANSQLSTLSINGTYLSLATSVSVGNVSCNILPRLTEIAPCRYKISRNTQCATVQAAFWGNRYGNTCENDPLTTTCINRAYYFTPFKPYSPQNVCYNISAANSCRLIRCMNTLTGACEVTGMGDLTYSLFNEGVQCIGPTPDQLYVCDSNSTCVVAKGPECNSSVICAISNSLTSLPVYPQVSNISISYQPYLNNSINDTILQGAVVIFNPPVSVNIEPSIASPGAAVVVNATVPNGMILLYYFVQDQELTGGIMPVFSLIQTPTLMQIYGYYQPDPPVAAVPAPPPPSPLSTPLELQILYMPAPRLFTLCPGIALAYTTTSVVVQGALFFNTTNLLCRFGPDVVPVAFVSDSQVVCTIYPTTDNVTSVPLAISNDNGAVFVSGLLVQILGSCATLKPNSLPNPASAACECPPGFEDAAYACLPCPRGTYQPKANQQSCLPCDAQTQTTTDTAALDPAACICRDGFYPREDQCLTCPPGLQCINQTLAVLPGFWRTQKAPVIDGAAICPDGEVACPGGSIAAGARESCNAGYQGPLCSQCAPGFAKSGGSGGSNAPCSACPSLRASAVILSLLLLVAASALYVLISLTTQFENGAGGNITSTKGSVATMVKICFSYLQILFYIGALSVKWSTQSFSFFSILVPLSLSPSFVVVKCALQAASAGLYFYTSIVVVMLMPVFAAGAVFLVTLLGSLVFPLSFSMGRKNINRYVLVVLYALHPMISHESLTALKCVAMPVAVTGAGGVQLLALDLQIDCASPQYVAVRRCVVAFLVLYVAGFPCLVAWNMLRIRDPLSKMLLHGAYDEGAHVYFYFVRGFSDRAILWEGVILFRKVSVVATSLISNVQLQLSWCHVFVVGSLVVTVWKKPFRSLLDNYMEVTSLLALWASVVIATHAESAANPDAITAPLVIVNIFALAYILWLGRDRFGPFWLKIRARLSLLTEKFHRQSADDTGDIKMYSLPVKKAAAKMPPDPAAVTAPREMLWGEYIDTPRPSPKDSKPPPAPDDVEYVEMIISDPVYNASNNSNNLVRTATAKLTPTRSAFYSDFPPTNKIETVRISFVTPPPSPRGRNPNAKNTNSPRGSDTAFELA